MTSSGLATRRRLVVVLAAAVALAGAACTSRDGGGAAQPQPQPQGGQEQAAPAVPAPPPAGATGGTTRADPPATPAPQGLPAAVARVLDRARDADRVVHTATYGVLLPGGPTVKGKATVKVAHRYPRFRFELVQDGQRSVSVFDGKLLHACDRVERRWRCERVDIVDEPSLVGGAYPPAVLQHVGSLNSGLQGGLRAALTTRLVRGRKVDCASYTPEMRFPPPPVVYCVRPDGVLAYARTSDGQVLELRSFRPSVDPADLAVPK